MQIKNKLILGTVQFGLEYGVNNVSGKPDQRVVNEILVNAHRAGVYCLDSAEAYGNAHSVIGQFHKDNPDYHFDIITKLPYHLNEGLDQKIELYLDQLNVKQLKGLLFHSYRTYKENRDLLVVLNELKRKGKVVNVGVSVYTNAEMEDVIKDKHIDIIQLPFNLLDNLNLRERVFKMAKENGKSIHTRSSFLQGLFFLPPENQNSVFRALSSELDYLRKLCKQFDISMQQMALNYCLQQAYIDNVLIGVDNLGQLQQNLAFANRSLPDEIIYKVNAIVVENVNLLNPSLWNQ